MRPRLAAVLFGSLITIRPTLARAATWHVYADGSGDAPTIQAAVDLASPGDSILIGPGTYPESVTVTEGLTLTSSSGAAFTIIDAEWTRPFCLATGGAVSDLLIEGLTFTGAVGGYGYGCQRSSALSLTGDVEIHDCTIRDNLSYGNSTIEGYGFLLVRKTRFTANDASGGGFCGGVPDPGCQAACIRWASGTLEVEECAFESNSGLCYSILSMWNGTAAFRNCVFRNNAPSRFLDYALFDIGWEGAAALRLEGNVFIGNGGSLLGQGYPQTRFAVDLLGNTFARNPELFAERPFLAAPGSLVEANIFTGAPFGLRLPGGGGGIIVECNNSWGNDTNWADFPDPTGTRGNISQPPKYCNPLAEDFSLAENSPCLPGNHPNGVDCGLIGALGQGCSALSIEPMSWGRIKGKYR